MFESSEIILLEAERMIKIGNYCVRFESDLPLRLNV